MMNIEELAKQIQTLNEKLDEEREIRKKLETEISILQEDVKVRKGEILNLEKQLTEIINTKVNDLSVAVQKAQDAANNAQGTADDAVKRANNAQGTADDAVKRANNAQGTADTARSEVSSVQTGIQNGSIIAHKATIAQKALMLRARNNNHWLRCQGTDSANRDCFGLWTTDNIWHNLILVGSTGKLPKGEVLSGPKEGPAELSSI